MVKITLSFRRATSEDSENLNSLINSSYRGDSARAHWTHEADLVDGVRTTPDELQQIINRPNEYFILAQSSGELVGSIYVRDEGLGFYFGMLAVKPGLHNQGIGAGLMKEVERIAVDENKKFIRLDVIHLRKELIQYYERKGYVLTGASEPFPTQYPAKIPGLILLEMKKTL